MATSLQARIYNARPLSRADNVSAFLILTTVRQKLELLSEFLDLADALDQPLRSTHALGSIVDDQIVALERLCDRLCPESLEA